MKLGKCAVLWKFSEIMCTLTTKSIEFLNFWHNFPPVSVNLLQILNVLKKKNTQKFIFPENLIFVVIPLFPVAGQNCCWLRTAESLLRAQEVVGRRSVAGRTWKPDTIGRVFSSQPILLHVVVAYDVFFFFILKFFFFTYLACVIRYPPPVDRSGP